MPGMLHRILCLTGLLLVTSGCSIPLFKDENSFDKPRLIVITGIGGR